MKKTKRKESQKEKDINKSIFKCIVTLLIYIQDANDDFTNNIKNKNVFDIFMFV